MKTVFTFSFNRGNPLIWKYIDAPIMINALDAPTSFKEREEITELWVDSGGYQVLTRNKRLNPAEIAKRQKALVSDYAIMPDNPSNPEESIRWYIKYLNCEERPEKTLPVIHTSWREKHVKKLITIIKKYGLDSFVALGSAANLMTYPFKPRNILVFLRSYNLVSKFFDRFHALGMGGYSLLPILVYLNFYSFDTASWIHDAKFGLLRVGCKAVSLRTRKRDDRNAKMQDEEITAQLNISEITLEIMKRNTFDGFYLRAIYNAKNLINYVNMLIKLDKNELLNKIRYSFIRDRLKSIHSENS